VAGGGDAVANQEGDAALQEGDALLFLFFNWANKWALRPCQQLYFFFATHQVNPVVSVSIYCQLATSANCKQPKKTWFFLLKREVVIFPPLKPKYHGFKKLHG
jgi:hypothetical protein